jgi:mannose-6-phosphate isomerase-like protein (cupin superfamily)
MGFKLIMNPSRIPAAEGKQIDEVWGRVNTGDSAFSVARMLAPPGWSEPAQTPAFGELTVVIDGTVQAEVEGETLSVGAGSALWVEPGTRVRYANPYAQDAEYFAICLPAFSPGLVRRER